MSRVTWTCICGLLEGAGYQVCTAGSYHEAVKCIENLPYVPDLLLTDIALPEVNGIELYRKFSSMTGVWMNCCSYPHTQALRYCGFMVYRSLTFISWRNRSPLKTCC